VQDVFNAGAPHRVPLSSGEIAGVLNLRGRIVTVVDMRARLGLPKTTTASRRWRRRRPARRILWPVDRPDREVLNCPDDGREENPVNLDPRRPSSPAACTARRPAHGRLDVDRVLEIVPRPRLPA